jgi:arylsulfatase A-like enzyme
LLTGRYAWRTRLQSGVLWGYSPPLIEPGRETLASLLRGRGYTTGCIGKWHLGLGWPTRQPAAFGDRSEPAADLGLVDFSRPLTAGPLTVGFDYFFGIPASLDMDPYVYLENDRVETMPTGRTPGGTHQSQGGEAYWRAGPSPPGFHPREVLPRLVAKAEAYLERQSAETPFFLYLPLTAPHDPWVPTAEFRGRSAAGDYGDFVAQVDDAVGRVMLALERRGFATNTLLMVTSDNGAHWTPEDIARWGHRANGPWRGQKSDAWEGGHRVPFLARWPGKIPPGTTTDALIGLVDLFATVAEITGAPVPPGQAEDSRSFLPALLGRPAPPREPLVLHSISGVFALHSGDWKLIESTGSGGWSPGKVETPAQLYDLRLDPAEATNRYSSHPDRVAELRARLTAVRASSRGEGR